jgi:hypothetical protein
VNYPARRVEARREGNGSALLIVGLALAGCGADSPASPAPPSRDGAVDASYPTILPSRLPPDFHCDPTLASLRDTVFMTSCAFDSCHGRNNPVYNLILETDVPALEKELVGVAAEGCKGWTYVVAGNVDQSFLWKKIAEPNPACGVQMPQGIEPLPASALSCFREWIEGL